MKKIEFARAEFIKSALSIESLPELRGEHGRPLPEIAFVGKSNVGKSSLINHLLNQKGLARVSATPGKTQTLNFFTVDELLTLVDLPGYGYAKVSKGVQAEWASGIENYFLHRQPLRLILLLIDTRRGLSDEDAAFVNWADHHGKKLLVIFTKSDKLTQKEKETRVRETRDLPVPFLHYSIKDPRARKALIENINLLLDTDGPLR